jgi:hypothetical protein
MLAERGGRGGTALEALKSPLLYQLSYRVQLAFAEEVNTPGPTKHAARWGHFCGAAREFSVAHPDPEPPPLPRPGAVLPSPFRSQDRVPYDVLGSGLAVRDGEDESPRQSEIELHHEVAAVARHAPAAGC